jgi:hypothetical protein
LHATFVTAICASSELTLCSLPKEIFTFISLSLLYSLLKYSCIHSLVTVHKTSPNHLHTSSC